MDSLSKKLKKIKRGMRFKREPTIRGSGKTMVSTRKGKTVAQDNTHVIEDFLDVAKEALRNSLGASCLS